MPPAIIAVAAAVATALIPLVTTSIILGAILTIGIAIAAQIAISLTQGRKPTNQRTNQGEELKLKLDPGMPRQLVLGRAATGGSLVWSFTYGSFGDIPTNAYLVRVVALSDLPCSGLVGVYEGKNQLAFTSDPTTGLAQCTTHMRDDGTPSMWVQVHLGQRTGAVADANLISWSGGLWTANHKGTGMCYAVTQYLYDGEGNAFPNGEPQLVYVLDGVKEYDQRFDSSRGSGHSGTQRLNDPATWAYSRNTAVIAQQVLRGFYSNGVLLLGAQADDRDLDDAMLLSAYNTCDESVAYSGGSQPRYRAGYIASSSQSTADILIQLQAAMDGRIIDRGGGITIRPGATHTPVFTLTDNDIIWDEEKSWQPRFDLSTIYNFVDGVFVDEQTIFQEKPFPTLRSATYEAQDGGQRFEYQIAYGAATDWAQVQRMTKRIFVQSRLQGTVGFYLPLWSLEMEQDDWFVLSSNRFGFSNKYFQAVTMDIVSSPTIMVSVIGQEMDPGIDGWDPAVDEKPRGDTFWSGASPTALPVPTLTPTAIIDTRLSHVSERYGVQIGVTGLGTTRTIGETLEIQIALQSDLAGTAATMGTFPSRNQTIKHYGLLPATDYAVRGRTYNVNKAGTWSAWANFTTLGSTLNYQVVVDPTVIFQSDTSGNLQPASQLPKVIAVDVQRAGTSIKTSNSVSYAIEANNCTATVNNTNGSGSKGNITVTAFPGWTAGITLTVTVNGIQLPNINIILQKSVSAVSGGGTTGGSSGGSGVKTASDSLLLEVNNSAFTAMTDVMTVTLASGESLYGTGTVQYDSDGLDAAVTGKWQYSPHSANTWTDFATAITGSNSRAEISDPESGFYKPARPGSLVLTQTKGGLAAGDYDVRAMGKTTLAGSIADPYGTLTITAKV